MPLVSVVVPTFNRAYCLARTLDSALAQTYADIEVLVVDDGSTDDTQALIESRYGHDSRIHYFNQPNGGVSKARNTGIAAARGAFVALLDSDDVWHPWKIELQVACMQAFPDLVMVWTDMEAVDPTGHVFDAAYIRTMYSAYKFFSEENLFPHAFALNQIAPSLRTTVQDARLLKGTIFSQMIMGSLVHTSTVLIRRQCLDRVRGFDESLHYAGEDYDFHLRTCREGPVGFIDLASIRYQRGMPDRLTRDEYRIHIATNFLNTVKPFLETARDEIKLPQHMIDSMLAETYLWIGEVQVDMHESRAARSNLMLSLHYRFFQTRAWGLYMACFLPRGALDGLRANYRRLKARVQRRAARS